MDVPLPAVSSYVSSGARKSRAGPFGIEERYPSSYGADGTAVGHLRFALKHEPLDLGVLFRAFTAMGAGPLERWVRAEPTGAYSRRAWFLYETLTGETLDLAAVRTGNYVSALDERLHFVAAPRNSSRQRVRDNLLGTTRLCPTLRRTDRLEQMIRANLAQEARALLEQYAPETLARAVSFLYTKETRSSFAIEGEAPSAQREDRFLKALQGVASFNAADPKEITRLQQVIVDARYAATGWRTVQNFVAETTRHFEQQIHFICPKPEDVPDLMDGWCALTSRLREGTLDPVLAAAVVAFAFVFIRPFEDGNGRIHRFLIHDLLARRGFSPPGVIFPISVAILRHRQRYESALDAFSRPLLSAIQWRWTPDGGIAVDNDTYHLYRFFDATVQAEYLFEQVAQTIRVDLRQELEFLETYDAAYRAVTSVVDMPNRRAALLVKLFLQNEGRLSKNERRQFEDLSESELDRMEAGIQEILRSEGRCFPGEDPSET